MATTEFTHSEPASPVHGFQLLLQAGATCVVAAWRAAKNRRAVNQLLQWDGRMLRDIGLTESDVRSALSSRFDDDPSAHLSAFTGERRQAASARRSGGRFGL